MTTMDNKVGDFSYGDRVRWAENGRYVFGKVRKKGQKYIHVLPDSHKDDTLIRKYPFALQHVKANGELR